jgi:hypothetical protein
MKRHPVLEVRDGVVICGGMHRTAPLRLDPDKPAPAVGEMHNLLRPVFHLGEVTAAGEIVAGDVIEERDDGRKVHCPRSKGQ